MADQLKRLPVEIFGEIFTEYLNYERSPWCPLIIGAVCEAWRSVALRTPRLWSKIYISPRRLLDLRDPFYRERMEQARRRRVAMNQGLTRTEEVRVWAQRAGACPLDFYFYYPIMWKYNAGQGVHQLDERITNLLLDIIKSPYGIRHLTVADLREQVAILETYPPIGPMLFPTLGQPVLNQVEKLSLINFSRSAWLNMPLPPKLCHLEITSESPFLPDSAVLSSLKSVRLEFYSGANRAEELIPIFNAVSNIEDVTLYMFASRWSELAVNTGVVHQCNVRRLHIQLSAPPEMFDYIHFPSLQVLSLSHFYEDKSYKANKTFTELIQKSLPPLQILNLTNIPLRDDTLICAMEVLPTLQQLRLHGVAVSNGSMNALGNRSLCPLLEVLDVKAMTTPYGRQRITIHAMENLLLARNSPLCIVIFDGQHLRNVEYTVGKDVQYSGTT